MMLTKLLRARDWAGELRRAAPQIRDDADQFIDATSVCEELQAEFVSDPQRLFNGGELPLRFMEGRGSAGSGPSHDYRVGGRVDLLELRVACEVFLAQIDQHFFSDDLPNETRRASGILAYLDLAEEQIVPPEDEAPPPSVH
jgi:hypothetical protein